jgi:hypothetical protein
MTEETSAKSINPNYAKVCINKYPIIGENERKNKPIKKGKNVSSTSYYIKKHSHHCFVRFFECMCNG